jgi:hypothetical protein
MSGQLHASAVLSPGQYRCTNSVGACVGPRDGGGFWLKENLVSLPGIEPGFLGCPIRSLLTVPTTLSQIFTHLKYAKHVGLNLLIVGINLDNHTHQQMHTVGL